MNFWDSNRYLRWVKRLTLIFCGFAVVWIAIGVFSRLYKFRDDDPGRGAVIMDSNKFGDHFSQVTYLPQGWSPHPIVCGSTIRRKALIYYRIVFFWYWNKRIRLLCFVMMKTSIATATCRNVRR